MRLPVPRHLEAVTPTTPTTGEIHEQLLEIFFDQMPMGIAVFDTDLRLVRCSKSWSGFFVHYLGVGADYVTPGRSIFELIPENEEALRPLLEGVLAGNVVRQQAHRLEKDCIVTYWDVVFAPTFRDGEVVGFVDIVTDATERRLAYEALETRVAVLAGLASAMTVDQPVETTIQEATSAALQGSRGLGAACRVALSPSGTSFVAADGADLGAELFERLPTHSGTPLATAGSATDIRVVPRFRAAPDASSPSFHVVVLPVESGQTRFGEFAVAYAEDEEYEDDLPVLQAVADLAASAVENARLYRAAEQSAALLERQRLARELHDSVSQALFSMTLHARTAQRLLQRADPAGADQLDAQLAKLCELSTGALAEMRALIFELRPGAVVEEGFAAALSRQVHALTARENLDITITCPGERVPLDPNTEEHLYRICLEALHNVVKHAHASSAQVQVAVDQENERLAVAVRDDGAGFDPTIDRPGHLGQRTMRERAEAIGATLRVVSAPGAGTEVRLALPLRARS